jgi:hypothetical protein
MAADDAIIIIAAKNALVCFISLLYSFICLGFEIWCKDKVNIPVLKMIFDDFPCFFDELTALPEIRRPFLGRHLRYLPFPGVLRTARHLLRGEAERDNLHGA